MRCFLILIFKCREARQIGITKYLGDAVTTFGCLYYVKSNCNGTKIALMSNTVSIDYEWNKIIFSGKLNSY